MSPAALLLVLAAAFAHATWNLAAKRVPATLPFVWLFTALSVVVWAPLAAWVIGSRGGVGWSGVAVGAVSAVLHSGYFLLLQHAYGGGDLSLVYPVARGSGALFAMAGAVALLGERPVPIAVGGALLVAVGVLVLADPAVLVRWTAPRGTLLALATGGVIACYTLWDGRAVRALLVSPLLLTWLSDAGRVALLAPVAARDRSGLRVVWARHRREALLVAVLSPLAYLLVLWALTFASVSGVAAAREVSVLVGVVLGVKVLGERRFGRRIVAAGLIAAGLVGLALGGRGA